MSRFVIDMSAGDVTLEFVLRSATEASDEAFELSLVYDAVSFLSKLITGQSVDKCLPKHRGATFAIFMFPSKCFCHCHSSSHVFFRIFKTSTLSPLAHQTFSYNAQALFKLFTFGLWSKCCLKGKCFLVKTVMAKKKLHFQTT